MSARKLSSTTYPINFLMVLSIDHLTGAVSKSPTVTLSKNGGAFGAAAGAVTEVANGIYSLAGNATDRNALGELWLHATATGCDPVDVKVDILTDDPFAAGTVDTAAIAAAVWDRLTSLLTVSGSIGALIVAKLGLITQGAVTYSAPVAPNTGNLSVVKGDDYTVTSGRVLPSWTSQDWLPYDLSTATAISFRAKTKYGETVFTKSMLPAISDTEVRLELTDSETGALEVGRDMYSFDVQATLLTGDIVTLVLAKMTVISDVR